MQLLTTSSADIIQECRVMFGVKSVSKSIFKCIPARQWTDICNTRCSILSRFLHFPPLQSGATNSCLAFSTPATWCRIFISRILYPCNPVLHFHVSHSRIFSVPQCSCVLIRNISMMEICIWAYTKMANPHSPVTCTGCIAYDQQ